VGRYERNASCPCGSGLKFKRCCVGREDALERRADALEVLAGLGSFFPLMRPCGGELETWLAEHATPSADEATLDDGISHLTDNDRRAIIDAHALRYPDVWRGLVDDVGGSETAERIAIAGAVAAALSESRAPSAQGLVWVAAEHEPAEALAFALDPMNLWSIAETTLLDEALSAIDDTLDDDRYEVLCEAALERVAWAFWSDAHARRLDVLVQRLRASLPTLKPERAAQVLGEACVAFDEDEAVRRRVGALLLWDSLAVLERISRAAAA
jgi:SEC-C motif